jgi:alanyl-tRNA synthetase
LREKLGATEFLGYETESAEGVVTALFKDGADCRGLKAGESGAIVNQTPFYGESGGQVGDIGVMTAASVQIPRHRHPEEGRRSVRAYGRWSRAAEGRHRAATRGRSRRRSSIRANHSATHLLHEALRQILGDHVAQKGSLVAPERLRFDFSHPKPMTAEEIARVEDIANDSCWRMTRSPRG